MQIKIFAMLLLAIVSQAFGNVLLSKGMKTAVGAMPWEPNDALKLFLKVLTSPTVLSGIALLIVFFVLFAAVLSKADLSFVLPAISFEVVLNVAFASYFLNETVSATRWAGTGLISLGVILVLRSDPRTFTQAETVGRLQEESGR